MRFSTVVFSFLAVLAFMYPAAADEWPGWLGPGQSSISDEVPAAPFKKKILWRRPMMGECYGGIAAANGCVIVPDHGNGKDFFRCYTAEHGATAWVHSYDNTLEIEYNNAPRATPLIADGRVYALGAAGDLHCLDLKTGELIWQKNFVQDFGAQVPQYGFSSSPAIADGKLITNPGGPQAAVVALDPATGESVWKTPGTTAAYAGFLLKEFGGVKQIITYDKESLGGWRLSDGERLWKLVPENSGDFNVGTPVAIGDKLLVATDNNYARLYKFNGDGKIVPEPIASNSDMALDMATPVVYDGAVYATSGGLLSLDAQTLSQHWIRDAEMEFWNYSSIIAGSGRLLVCTESGKAYLIEPTAAECKILSSTSLCKQTWSHPALANGRLYIRDERYMYCYDLTK